MMVWLVVISNTIVSSIGVLVSLSRLCQKCFLSKRKRLTLNELELYHELRSSHIQKLYELKWLMSECYRPGQQVQMKSIDVKLDLLMDLGCWIMHEVIILSEPKRLTKRGHPSLHLLYQSRHSSNTVVPSSADLTCFAMESILLLPHLKQVYNKFSRAAGGFSSCLIACFTFSLAESKTGCSKIGSIFLSTFR